MNLYSYFGLLSLVLKLINYLVFMIQLPQVINSTRLDGIFNKNPMVNGIVTKWSIDRLTTADLFSEKQLKKYIKQFVL